MGRRMIRPLLVGAIDNRADDERLLSLLRLRTRLGAASAARARGLPSERVRSLCNRVLADDLRASVMDGIETPGQVMAGYWGGL